MTARSTIVLLLCVIAIVNGLRHPGVLVGQGQLNYIRQQVNAQAEPFYSAYRKALNSNIGSKSYTRQGPPSNNIIECGSSSNPNYGCSADNNDGAAAYLQSILWYITSDVDYLNKAIALLNAYSRVTAFTNSNAPLQAAWSASKWTRAAEIVRHTSTSWASADITRFKNTLINVHLPLIRYGSTYNGNWELAMIEGVLGIAVFADDQSLFDEGVTMWNQRVPAYFYDYQSDGSNHRAAPRGNPSWYGQTTFNANTDGISQETCRDFGHVQYGLASTLNAAATAAIQGVTLFDSQSDRLVGAMEFHAKYLNGASVPSYICGGTVDLQLYATFELGYNHYHNKDDIDMPHTQELIEDRIRSLTYLSDYHISIWETLTNSGSP